MASSVMLSNPLPTVVNVPNDDSKTSRRVKGLIRSMVNLEAADRLQVVEVKAELKGILLQTLSCLKKVV